MHVCSTKMFFRYFWLSPSLFLFVVSGLHQDPSFVNSDLLLSLCAVQFLRAVWTYFLCLRSKVSPCSWQVYSCDTEGYYTSFHMDSGLKTLKEEEIGSGFSLPPTPLHSTSALSNCSSGRGSASLAQLTAESEYELFGKGSTSTTASSAGTVCTTLLADHSRGGDNSLGSDRSLSKGPTVPERKSSLVSAFYLFVCSSEF